MKWLLPAAMGTCRTRANLALHGVLRDIHPRDPSQTRDHMLHEIVLIFLSRERIVKGGSAGELEGVCTHGHDGKESSPFYEEGAIGIFTEEICGYDLDSHTGRKSGVGKRRLATYQNTVSNRKQKCR
jgi:hypothetical protein